LVKINDLTKMLKVKKEPYEKSDQYTNG